MYSTNIRPFLFVANPNPNLNSTLFLLPAQDEKIDYKAAKAIPSKAPKAVTALTTSGAQYLREAQK